MLTGLETARNLAFRPNRVNLHGKYDYPALPRIADQSQADGMFVESLMAALAERGAETRDRLQAFLDKRTAKIGPAGTGQTER